MSDKPIIDHEKLFDLAQEIIDPDALPSPWSFAGKLRAWRVRRGGITMAEAARRLNVPYRTLQDWQAGLHAPRGLARRLIEARLKR